MKTLLLVATFTTATFLMATAADNTLTQKQESGGWKPLFDGKSLAGWRAYGKSGVPDGIGPGWKVEEGSLKKLAGVRGGDIITETSFEDFEFSWEWRLAQGANSGVKYLVTEQRPQAPGLEYQMIDDPHPKFAKLAPKHSTASLYDMLPPSSDKPLKTAGEWNQSRVVVRGRQVEHWLNGKKVLAYELSSPALKTAIAGSKFKSFPDFGAKVSGHIMLTDHQDEASFRNLKIRPLAP